MRPGPRLQRQLELALEILGEPVANYTQPLSERPNPNHTDPPMVDLVGTKGVRKCNGCNEPITREEKKDTLDMVFKRKGMREYYQDYVLHQYSAVVYYHLKMRCINKKEPTMEPKDITCHDNIFMQLTAEQMQLLKAKHYLPYIIANRQ